MSFEEMYQKIDALEHQMGIVISMLKMQQPVESSNDNDVISGPEIRKCMGLSETQFRRVQERMPFLFRYTEGGTLRAFRKDFDLWFKTQYRPEV